jgi:hypothetical protein
MELKQKLIEGILIGVVGGLVATAIGGVGLLAYNEMRASRAQLADTTKATKQLNQSSITSIDRMNVIEDSISSLIKQVHKLEEENKIIAEANNSNREAIKLLSETIKGAEFSDKSEANAKILEAEKAFDKSSKELKSLPEITSDRDKIRIQQQEQQIKLEGYRDTQEKQKQQQQQRQ